MNLELGDIAVAFLMVGFSIVVIFWYLESLESGSENRMLRMMEKVGLDSHKATLDDPRVREVIKSVRSRCRKCQSEDVCERWLANEAAGDNTFCPNAKIFLQLKRNIRSVPLRSV